MSKLEVRVAKIRALKIAIRAIDKRLKQLRKAHEHTTCPLCKAYYYDPNMACLGCPVSAGAEGVPVTYYCYAYSEELVDIECKLMTQKDEFIQELKTMGIDVKRYYIERS